MLRTLLAYAMTLKIAQDSLGRFLSRCTIALLLILYSVNANFHFFAVTLGSSPLKALITLPKLYYYAVITWSLVSCQLAVASCQLALVSSQ